MTAWPLYASWNSTVAAVVFPELPEPVPVYLDLEEEVLEALAAEAGHPGPAREGLMTAVQAVTCARDRFSLATLWRHELAWRRQRDWSVPPPCLTFLALSCLAAEEMGNADDGFNPADYYSRLCVLLGRPAGDEGVRREYQAHAEGLWADLNRWLEGLEGKRGMPTAYALSHRYVGLPMSQALVREGDRRKLPLFFAQYGLAAGMELAPEVLERFLDAWFSSESCPLSTALKRLWQRAAARERIATVAALELQGWDGTLPQGQFVDLAHVQRLSITAQLREGFLGRSVDLGLVLRAVAGEQFDGSMEVEGPGGEWLPLNLVPVIAGVWRTSYLGGLDMGSVLEGVVKMRPPGQSDSVARHHPRTIVPLVFDEMQASFVEQERLQLNVDSMLLVRKEAKGRTIASKVAEALDACARPGFQVHEELPGLPVGWALISGVQLFGAPVNSAFNELVPLARDQLTIAGGMRIPSRVRKWSVVAPPELRASVDSAATLRLVLRDLEDDSEQTWRGEGGALVVSLEGSGLGPGDYRAALFSGSSIAPLQQATLRLRSAAGVDSSWILAPRLVYPLAEPGGPACVVSAMEDDGSDPAVVVDGPVSSGWNGIQAVGRASGAVSWQVPPPAPAAPPPVSIGSPDPTSCVVTGAHHSVFPTFMGGWQPKYIEGVCKYCGLVTRSPGWARRRRTAVEQRAAQVVMVEALPPVGGASHLWDAALDALMHLGGGSASSLAGVAAQIDGSALFGATFPTALEMLGHIAVERAADGTPLRWEVSPSCLVARPEGLELTGYWNDEFLGQVAGALRADVLSVAQSGRPSRRFMQTQVLDPVEDLVPEHVTVVRSPVEGMLAALPTVSQVAAALPREPMPGFVSAERYDVMSSAWIPTRDVSLVGAYRLVRGFERLHVFRSQADVASRTAARGSVYLVKHLAANAAARSLAAYIEADEALVVPRGGDLPGLYGRAAVLASGALPTDSALVQNGVRRKCLVYRGLARSHADLLVTLLNR